VSGRDVIGTYTMKSTPHCVAMPMTNSLVARSTQRRVAFHFSALVAGVSAAADTRLSANTHDMPVMKSK
jgi:hypothetical protein